MSDANTEKYSVSDLFMHAARRLKKEFDYIRETNPHSATKGSEAEKVLRDFLNNHLPQRFHATTGILIDTNNVLSKQTDVIIYDALSSPVYRYSKDAMILPIDTVASVIEVKSRLTSEELADAYQKIASVKSLKKKPSSEMDLAATGSKLKMASTLGVIFAFTSDITLDTAAEKMEALNTQVESRLWPDMVVVLDVGTLNYAIHSPGGEISGDIMPREDEFGIMPFYVSLVLRKDGELSLNRFFITLLAHLQFFPHRPSVPPFEIALAGTSQECVRICAYQYDRKKNLLPAKLSELELPAAIQIKGGDNDIVATLHWLPWPSGGTIACEAKAPLGMFLMLAGFGNDAQVIRCGDRQYSSVLPVTRAEFLRWPQRLNPRLKGMRAEVVVFREEPISDEGTSTPFIARLLVGILEIARRVLSPESYETFKDAYPFKMLLSLRRLIRELGSSTPIRAELVSAILQMVADVAESILNIAKRLGVDASFLLYREPAYLRGLERKSDEVLATYLKEHRNSWARTVAQYLSSSITKRNEIAQSISHAELESIISGVAKLTEELMIYALQVNARVQLKIRQIDKNERDVNNPQRFTTNLKESWPLIFSSIPFDEL